VSLYIGFEKLGIVTPSLQGRDMATIYEQARRFMSGIGPSIRDGYLAEARREAPRLIANMGAEASVLSTAPGETTVG
jgi:hypothetical protein